MLAAPARVRENQRARRPAVDGYRSTVAAAVRPWTAYEKGHALTRAATTEVRRLPWDVRHTSVGPDNLLSGWRSEAEPQEARGTFARLFRGQKTFQAMQVIEA